MEILPKDTEISPYSKIAFQGVEGAYSHLACRHCYPDLTPIAYPTFEEAMESVEREESKYAMIPIENSTAGRVEEIYRLIPKMSLSIVAEHFERVNHCLIGLPDAKLENIKYVSSHPQALAQCNENISKLNLVSNKKFDTAGSVKELKELNSLEYGAIASSLSAEIYKLNILEHNFQDHNSNTTRFIILSKEPLEIQEGKTYLTSLIFNLKNVPSALYKALGGFATNGINIVKIESYTPVGKFKLSQFHIDVESNPKENSFKFAIDELKFFAKDIKILGSYLKSETRDSSEIF